MTTSTGARGGLPAALRGWWFEPVPLARVAIFRTIVYLFAPLDVLVLTPWVWAHARVPTALYQPLVVGRLLHLPTPTHAVVMAVGLALVITSVAAATGRAPRLLGVAVLALYGEWMVIAMSYGKVDHDRFAYLVALAVLPTIGRVRRDDPTRSEAAGWAMRCVQVSVVLTYFLAAWAKIRFGGLDWPTGATLARAIVRRGTFASGWLLHQPHLLEAGQFLMIGGELLSPLLLFARSDRARVLVVAGLLSFHLATFAGVTIIFWPHLVAMTSMLPWDRLRLRRPRLAADPLRPPARSAGAAGTGIASSAIRP